MKEEQGMSKPKVDAASQKELDKVEKQFDNFNKQVKELNLDRDNGAKVEETEPQTKLSTKEIQKSNELYLKPIRTQSSRDKFNEKFRDAYNFKKEYVHFVAEHKELIGEKIEMWTRPFGGMDAEYWEIPTNKPVWAPRYVADQIKGARYHRLRMEEKTVTSDGMGSYYGHIVADSKVQRLDANPVSDKKSIFMGASSF